MVRQCGVGFTQALGDRDQPLQEHSSGCSKASTAFSPGTSSYWLQRWFLLPSLLCFLFSEYFSRFLLILTSIPYSSLTKSFFWLPELFLWLASKDPANLVLKVDFARKDISWLWGTNSAEMKKQILYVGLCHTREGRQHKIIFQSKIEFYTFPVHGALGSQYFFHSTPRQNKGS